MYIPVRETLGQPPEVLRDFEEQKRRFEVAKADHERRLTPLPLDLLPLQVLIRAGVKTTTRVGRTTASLMHQALDRSRLLRPYIERKLLRLWIPTKFIHHNSDAEFDTAYMRLHKTTIPTGSEKKELQNKRGFYHPQTNAIHLRPSTHTGHALHEAIHKFASPGFQTTFGSFLNEGVTQYFTDLVLQEQGLDRMEGHFYQSQLACANRLVQLFGQDLVARAYFQGKPDLARNVVRRLNTDFLGLHRLKSGDNLCQRLHRLRA